MAQDQKVTLTFSMSDGTKKSVDFIVPGGKDGLDASLPDIIGEEVSDPISQMDMMTQVNDLIFNPITAVKSIMWSEVIYPEEEYGYGNPVTVTVIPTKSGKYAFITGDYNYKRQNLSQVMWIGDDRTYTPILQSSRAEEYRGYAFGDFFFVSDDAPENKDACGLYGTSIYLKATIQIRNAPQENTGAIVQVWTDRLPCMADGTLVPYNIWAEHPRISDSNKVIVEIYMTCPTPPTHLIDPVTKNIKKIQRPAGQVSGLANVYPEAPEGEAPNAFRYNMAYYGWIDSNFSYY